jgi:outer membrane receptor protein involved in Fe transport
MKVCVRPSPTFSGPIIQDKLHFLASYEEKAFETPRDVNGGNGISSVPVPAEYQALLGRFPGRFDEELFFGKLDWWINDDQSLEASIKLRDEVSYNFGGANTQSFAGTARVEEERLNLKHTLTGARFQNEIRLTTEDVEWAQQPARFESAQRLQTANRQDILNIGGNAGYQAKGQKGWTIQDDFTWLDLEWNGNHVIKTGIKYRDIDLEILQQHNTNPQYFYNVEINGPGTFNVVQPNRVEWFVPASGSDVGGAFVSAQKQYSFYIQDDWDINDRLTLNIGLRWDYEDNPTYTDYVTPANLVATLEGWANIQDTDYDYRDYISTGNNRDNFKDAWAPRLGFSYVLDDDSAHTLFGGFGRSYDRNQFDSIQGEVLRGTFATAQFMFTGDPDEPCDPMTQDNCVAWDPVYLTQEGLDSLITDVEVLDEAHLLPNDLKTPYSDQVSLGIRSTWGDYWSTEASLSHVESYDQFSRYLGNRREDGSFFAPGTIWGPPFGFGLPDRGRSLIIGRNDGETETDSVYLKVSRAHVETWGFNVAYTYTDATENRLVSESFNLNYPTIDGYSGYRVADVPKHSLVATGTYDLPWDIQGAAKFTYKSSPIKQFVNESNGAGQFFFDRIEPNDGDFQSFDLSLVKSFATSFLMDESELWVRFDVDNLFNRKNYRNFILGYTNAEFGQPNVNSSTIGLRSLKLSAGWRF